MLQLTPYIGGLDPIYSDLNLTTPSSNSKSPGKSFRPSKIPRMQNLEQEEEITKSFENICESVSFTNSTQLAEQSSTPS